MNSKIASEDPGETADGAAATGGHVVPGDGVLDARALADLAQLDPTGANRLVPRVLSTYLGSLARLVQQLAAATAAGDMAAVRLAVHTLKSSSASVGALALSELCAEAERVVRQERIAEVPALVDRLLVESERVRLAVLGMLND